MKTIIKEYQGFLKLNERKSSATIKNYMADLTHFEKFLKEIDKNTTEGIKTIGKRDLLNYMQCFSELSAATYNRRLSGIKSFYSFLVSYEYISKFDNHAMDLKSVKQRRKIPIALSEEEVISILDISNKPIHSVKNSEGGYSYEVTGGTYLSCTEKRNRAIIYTIFTCGLRAAEVSSIKIKNITDDSIKVLGKGDKERVIPLSKMAKIKIDEYIECRHFDSESLFTMREKDEVVSTDTINRIVKKYANVIGIDPKMVSSHIARKSFATSLLKRGVDSMIVGSLLGHEDANTTKMYLDIDSEMKTDAIGQLGFLGR